MPYQERINLITAKTKAQQGSKYVQNSESSTSRSIIKADMKILAGHNNLNKYIHTTRRIGSPECER